MKNGSPLGILQVLARVCARSRKQDFKQIQLLISSQCRYETEVSETDFSKNVNHQPREVLEHS